MRASWRARRTLLLLLAGAAVACGYRPLYSEAPADERLSVVASGVAVTRASAVHAALSGARAELARAGMLRRGEESYPRLVVEVQRVEEDASGVVVDATSPTAVPRARGSVVAVVGRAWVQARRGGDAVERTPELRRVQAVAAGATAGEDRGRNRAAVDAAATRLGRDLVRLLIGLPTIRRESL